jgi:hypothetical protein
MKPKKIAVRVWGAFALAAALAFHTTVRACSDGYANELPVLALRATSPNQQEAAQTTSEDAVRNEYLLHSRLHEWFAGGAAPSDTDKLNAKVHAELFLTPESDPWLGLVPRDTFTALDNHGIVQISGMKFNTTTQTKTGL